MPTIPPRTDSTQLSTSIWRIRRPRDAPSDKRTASSLCRMNARAISRFATFAHAISSTRPTMHISTMRPVEKSLRSGENPVAALVTSILPFMNWSREYGDHSFAAGSVISY